MTAYLCLGSNLSHPRAQLNKARKLLAVEPGTKVLRASSVRKSQPYGKSDQPCFWNQVLEIQTSLSPQELLKWLLAMENAMGRVRREKWGPRIIDLDILFYEDLVLQTSELILPHPDLHNRRFALRLLNELAPDLIHPVFKKSVATLLRGLDAAKEK